jgi:hypothetical protein
MKDTPCCHCSCDKVLDLTLQQSVQHVIILKLEVNLIDSSSFKYIYIINNQIKFNNLH